MCNLKPIDRIAMYFSKMKGLNYDPDGRGSNINIGILDDRESNNLFIKVAPSQAIEYYAGSNPTYERVSFVVLYNGTNNYDEDLEFVDQIFKFLIKNITDQDLGIIKLEIVRPNISERTESGIFEWIFEVNGIFALYNI